MAGSLQIAIFGACDVEIMVKVHHMSSLNPLLWRIKARQYQPLFIVAFREELMAFFI